MTTPILETLRSLLEDDLDGVTATPEGLRAVSDQRFGEVTLRIDPDEDEQDDGTIALRVQAIVPAPIGAGSEFLIWCLHLNNSYWAVKLGVDDSGMLVVHADVEAEPDVKLAALAAEVIDRAESILQLLDEDLVEYCLGAGVGTPAQQARWEERRPSALEDDDE